MKFDTIIIGGGLSGLVCGIRLQKAGKKTAIVSAGQSAMHFSSGSFDLLNQLPDGTDVEEPLKAIQKLDKTHPYSKIGAKKVAEYAAQTKDFFAECGVELTGDAEKNSYRITPVGEIKRSWLSFKDFTLLEKKDEKLGSKVLVVNILGYMDFNTKFLASYFDKNGTPCKVVAVKLEQTERLRKNPTEMRATNISRVMDVENNWEKFVDAVKQKHTDEDLIILPAVFGLKDHTVIEKIKESLGTKTVFIATMPPSVPGIRTQMQLKNEYIKAGGEFILGDTVCKADMEGSKVKALNTVNFEEIQMHADNFVLASGSFFSKGLIADPYKVFEPVFGLDVDYAQNRGDWYDLKFFNTQNYIGFGVKTNDKLQTSKDGETIDNLYAIGSILSGANTLKEGCGAGVAIMSAMKVADEIIAK